MMSTAATPMNAMNNEVSTPRNHFAIAGFVVAMAAVAVCWVPFLNWIAWGVGLALSGIGMLTAPRNFAVAGLSVSAFGLFMIILLMTFGII